MKVRVHCDPPVCEEFIGKPPEGVHVDIVDTEHYTIDSSHAIVAVITWAATIPTKVISDWISNRIKEKGTRFFQMNGKKCELKKEDIHRLIEEITSEQNSAALETEERNIDRPPSETLPDYLL